MSINKINEDHVVRILLLGETGSGKSTFINYLGNYFLNGSLNAKDEYSKVKIVIPNKLITQITDKLGENCENNIKDQTQSQTSKSTIYKFTRKGIKVFEVIDTPGLADTRKDKDDENITNILKKASEMDYLTAIVLIINGSHARRTTTLRYVLSKLEGTVPDSLLKNLIVILTNCDELSCNFDLKLLKGLKPKYLYHMQNNAFSSDQLKKSEKAWRKLENEWLESMKTLETFIENLNNLGSVSANDFKEMIVLRQNLQCSANEIILKQTKLFQVIDILERRNKDVKAQEEIAEKNKEYKQLVQIKVIELQQVNYFSTVCQTHFKEKICHEHCGLKYQSDANEAHFRNCAAHSGNGSCNACSCTMAIHYHTYKIPKEKMSTEEQIIKEIKSIYDDAIKKKSSYQTEIQSNDNLKKCLLSDIDCRKKKLINACRQLKAICNNFNFHEELQAFIENLRKEAAISHNFHLKKEFNETANAIENLLNSEEFSANIAQLASYDENESASESESDSNLSNDSQCSSDTEDKD